MTTRRGKGQPRRRVPPADGVWRQVGGGYLLVGRRKYPCDATYDRRLHRPGWERRESFTVQATRDAYRFLPLQVKDAAEVTRAPGVLFLGYSCIDLRR